MVLLYSPRQRYSLILLCPSSFPAFCLCEIFSHDCRERKEQKSRTIQFIRKANSLNSSTNKLFQRCPRCPPVEPFRSWNTYSLFIFGNGTKLTLSPQ